MDSMTVLISSCHQRDFTVNCIKSYLRFLPEELRLKFVIVENSSDESYKDEVLAMHDDIIWVNNNTPHKIAVDAWSHGIEVGMEHVDDEYVFLSHNDVCITSESFYTSMIQKAEEGNCLIGTCSDTHPIRNKSIILLGCFVKSDIIRSVDLYQKEPHFEGGDRVHLYCKEKGLKWMCFTNSHNNPEIVGDMEEPFKSLDYTVRAINDDGNVIFLHFARGVVKTNGTYPKEGRKTVPEILKWCDEHILG